MRAARQRFGLSQGFLAPLLGVSRDQLNSVELGRVALRFDPGLTLCGELDLNPLWLAFGEPPAAGFIYADASLILDDDLFSEGVSRLRAKYREGAALLGTDRISSASAATASQISKWLSQISANELPAFWLNINRAAREFVRAKHGIIKRDLTTKAVSTKIGAMSWPKLQKEIVRLTSKERGLKTKLAVYAGVSRQVVSAWLSGAGTPDANKTFLLLEWVAAEQAKQKTKRAATGSTEAALTTRQSKFTSHEAKSNRKKQ